MRRGEEITKARFLSISPTTQSESQHSCATSFSNRVTPLSVRPIATTDADTDDSPPHYGISSVAHANAHAHYGVAETSSSKSEPQRRAADGKRAIKAQKLERNSAGRAAQQVRSDHEGAPLASKTPRRHRRQGAGSGRGRRSAEDLSFLLLAAAAAGPPPTWVQDKNVKSAHKYPRFSQD